MRNQKDLWKGDEFAKDEVSPDEWIKTFKRLEPTRGLVVTPCNAEPAIYEGCAEIVNKGLDRFQTHFYTNMSTESRKEIERFDKRDNLAFYVSYHHGQIDVDEFIDNAIWLQENYNVINFHAPMYPPFKQQILRDAARMKERGVILDTTHKYLGLYKDKMHYSYLLDGKKEPGDWIKNRLANRLEGKPKKDVLCKTSANHDSFYSRTYTVAPDGDIYTCWRYLYNHDKTGVLGNFFDESFQFKDEYFECSEYGDCNICAWHKDIKDAKTGEQLDVDIIDKVGKTISACMIVKNEEETLGDCLMSIDQWADEIIIVDTGSTDKTKEIADKFDKVRWFHQPWQENFSLHRNYSIEQATKDWIFIIDADERVVPGHGENLKKMLPEITQDIIAVDVYNLYLNDNGERIARSHLQSLRLFRRSYEPEYRGYVHNKPVIKGQQQVYTLPFTINHLGYDMPKKVMAEKYRRTVKMCRKWTKNEPENIEAFWQLARALRVKAGRFNNKAMPEIFKILSKAISLGNGQPDPNQLKPQILYLMGWMKHANKEHKEAVHYAKKALAYIPDYLDAIYTIAMANAYGISAAEGEKWLNRYLQEQPNAVEKKQLDSVVIEHINERKQVYKTLMEIEELREKQCVM